MPEKIMKKLRVGFFGRGTLGKDVLEGLLTNPSVEVPFIINCRVSPEVGDGREVFEDIARKYNIPFDFTNSLNNQKWIDFIRTQNLDLAVAMQWLDTINEDVISSTKLGFLNLHGGLLPRYRGNACSNWAILNEETEQGLTVHLMEPGKLDSGPIILQEKIPMNDRTTIKHLMDHINRRGAELVLEAVSLIVTGNYKPIPQREDNALRCYPRLPRDGEIDWNQNAASIERLIRAAGDPYPGAYSFYADVRDNGAIKKLSIDEASIAEHPTEFCAVPGHVLKGQTGIFIVCGDMKLLELKRIKVNGQAIAPHDAFRTVRQRMGLDTETLLNQINALTSRVQALENKS